MCTNIRVKASATWYEVKTDGIVYVLYRNGKVGSVKLLGYLSLCHITVSIFKFVLLLTSNISSGLCVNISLVCIM